MQQPNNLIDNEEFQKALAMLNEPTKRRIAIMLYHGQINPASITRSILRKKDISMSEYRNMWTSHIKKLLNANVISKSKKLDGSKYQDYCITPIGAMALERKGLIKKDVAIYGEY
jgi:hypothetical protein